MRCVHLLNMANDGFTSCIGLRKIGVDAHLFYATGVHCMSAPEWEAGDFDESKIGNPNMPDVSAFHWKLPDWCHPVFSEAADALYMARNLVSEFSRFDVVIGHWPFVRFTKILREDGMRMRKHIVYEAGMIRQLESPNHSMRDALTGYRDATMIMYVNVDLLPVLQALEVDRFAQYVPLPIDTKRYIPPKKRENKHLVFLAPARHSWSEKGNDMLIAAFAEYVRRNPKAQLKLCGWGGEDLQGSKMMVYRYRLGGNVTWLPMRNKKHLIQEYQKADAVFDQFIYAATGSTGPEAMSCGLPLVSRMTPEFFLKHHRTAPPILNAQEPHQIYEAMIHLEDEGFRKQLGETGRKWVRENQDVIVVAKRQKELCQVVMDSKPS